MPSTPDIAQHIETAVTPVLAGLGMELVLVEYIPRQQLLRLYIDQPSGITLDDCTRVSRLVSDMLDAEGFSDRIAGRYHLEVSSPGLDRPLVRPKDYERFVGSRVNVLTRTAVNGRRKFPGLLAATNPEGVELDVDGHRFRIRYTDIERAKLVPQL